MRLMLTVGFTRCGSAPAGLNLVEAAKLFKPTILLGLSAVGGLFQEPLIREVAKHCKKPFIFPLSNPTSSAECTAEQVTAARVVDEPAM